MGFRLIELQGMSFIVSYIAIAQARNRRCNALLSMPEDALVRLCSTSALAQGILCSVVSTLSSLSPMSCKSANMSIVVIQSSDTNHSVCIFLSA